MRLAFFGTGEFAVPALQAVSASVVVVVCQPDRPSGRGMRIQKPPIRLAAEDLNIPVLTPEKARAPEFVDTMRDFGLDALLVASYGQILSQSLLDSAKRGGINLHGSILPKYRGAAPIQRCIEAGDQETGVTLMQMDKGMDTGDIIAIERVAIHSDETYGALQTRLAELAASMAKNWLPRICTGSYHRQPQDERLATVAPKVAKEEAGLNFDRPAQVEYNRFRAFTPSPGPFLRTKFGTIKIRACTLKSENGEPGLVLSTSPTLIVAFQEGSLELTEVQPEGKKAMAGRDFANGTRLRPGDFVSI